MRYVIVTVGEIGEALRASTDDSPTAYLTEHAGVFTRDVAAARRFRSYGEAAEHLRSLGARPRASGYYIVAT